ncbi:hypothetical protein BAC2_00164 [uncultured bacterium]|nr:hypothetical protein BAC2_00164 [uncultured bacterium]
MSISFSPDPPLRLVVKFQELYPNTPPPMVFQAPGRELWIAARANDREAYVLRSLDYNGAAPTTFSLQSAKSRRTVLQRPLPRWARYPAGVIVQMSTSGLDLPGLDAVICGNEARGPRYEYGLGMLFAALCYEMNDQRYLADALTEVVDRVQREYMEGVV